LSKEEDYDLVRRLRSRNAGTRQEAFEALYAKYKDRVFGLAARILGDRHLAYDAVQSTFITILEKAEKFRFHAAFSSWLYRVTVNRCIDLRRRTSKHPRLSLSEPDVRDQIADKDLRRKLAGGPENGAEAEELHDLVERAVAGLDPRMSAVVLLRYMQGLDYAEIGKILDLPIGTVKSRLNRAHAALDSWLGSRLDDYL
jgi:RNA polymerase sigma-70 factor (ECF subfamily)